MIKRTLYFGNPAYLNVSNKQLVVRTPGADSDCNAKTEIARTIPIEDIGVVVLDNNQITITHAVMQSLIANNVAIISCDNHRMPSALTMPLACNTIQNERFRSQLDASVPLCKQLWQQTMQAKIENQARILNQCRGTEIRNMLRWSADVRSGDPDNLEARAAVYYWANIFTDFKRDPDGEPPNSLLNYGYAILRAIVARSLVASGLLPTLGIHHHNRYNAYCLADDIMEPYRPFIDKLVVELYDSDQIFLDKPTKAKLLSIPVIDVTIAGKKSPLMIAASITTASLAKCFCGESRKIIYPSVM